MKPEHIEIRIEQCLSLAKASHCPRRKLAAVLIDPLRNVVLADGYNGGPRGAEGKLCRGHWCERNGVGDQFVVRRAQPHEREEVQVLHRGERIWAKTIDPEDPEMITEAMMAAHAHVAGLKEKFPPIESGTRMELGCHHAEGNVICNAAANGTRTRGAWLIVLAEPCMMCAKAIHHAGIEKVLVVEGGYLGGKQGVDYLIRNGVQVQEVAGPQDPRLGDPNVVE